MVRIMDKKVQLDDKKLVEISCLSTDTKPVGFANGSLLLEIDTAYIYAYDEDGAPDSEWVKIADLGGGS